MVSALIFHNSGIRWVCLDGATQHISIWRNKRPLPFQATKKNISKFQVRAFQSCGKINRILFFAFCFSVVLRNDDVASTVDTDEMIDVFQFKIDRSNRRRHFRYDNVPSMPTKMVSFPQINDENKICHFKFIWKKHRVEIRENRKKSSLKNILQSPLVSFIFIEYFISFFFFKNQSSFFDASVTIAMPITIGWIGIQY